MPENKPRRSPKKRLWLRITGGFAFLCSVLTVAAIAVSPYYLHPRVDELRHADAIFVIGGYDLNRYSYGVHLATKGWAPTLVMSNPTNGDWMNEWCAKEHAWITKNECVVPDPPTTLGEARALRRLAAANNWNKVIVITIRPHIARARYIFERCFRGELIMIESPTQMSFGRWAYEYVYQSAGFAKAAFNDGC